ncbi:MAG: CPBP family intramembrane metalloprotease domain-containing protein [Flavobacteriaceae bacterium]|jgi:membrane protease YdiL (CAAX protease family)|nr:CPBP family intramembrane metalloprotease domain-containing protein [Flavobacteriaceae bacterium]|tara:strand:- start:4506 stop:5435 length:930 start_codon:yes stop_codon:yes gene_type:complete
MFIEKAKNIKNNWWRYFLVGPLIIFTFWQIIGAIPLGVGFALNADFENLEMDGSNDMMAMFSVFPSKNIGLALFLLMFAFGCLGLYLTIKFIHNQSIKSLTTSRDKIDYSRIFYSFFLVVGITVLFMPIDLFLSPDEYELTFNLNQFLILVIICLTLLPLQTSFEEYLIRGYLLQGIGITTKSRFLAFTIPSILFGLLHFANPEIDKLGNAFIFAYIFMGFFLGLITMMDEGLELALGWHYANNLMAALFITADWSVLQTDSIYKYIGEPDITSQILPALVIFPILIYHFSVKYKWSGWKEKLFGKVNI